MKRITIFGASGVTGLELTRLAVKRGYEVVAFIRSEAARQSLPSGVSVVTGSLASLEDLERAIVGSEAVICAFGPRAGSSDVFCAEATKNIIEAMNKQDVKRLVCLSGAMIGDYPHLSWFMRTMKSMYERQQPAQALDRADQERLVQSSNMDWTLVKPPRLSDGGERGRMRSGEALSVGMRSTISRSDLSSFILDQLVTQDNVGKRVVVQY